MMTSPSESVQDTSESERQAAISAQQTVGDCSSKRSVARIYSLCFLENRGDKVYHGGGGAKHEEDSKRELDALLICSSTTTRNEWFATLYADRKVDSPLQTFRPAEGNPLEHIPSTSIASSETRPVADESTSKRKEAEEFEFET